MRRLIVVAIVVACGNGCHDTAIPFNSDITASDVMSLPSQFNSEQTGTISGRVRWTGSIPEVPQIDVERILADGKVERVTRPNPHAPQIDVNGGVGGAVLMLRGVDPVFARPWNWPPVIIEMRDDAPIVRQGNQSTAIGFAQRGDDLTMVSKQPRLQIVRARGAAFFSLTLPELDKTRTRQLTETGRIEITSATGDTAVRGHVFVDDQPYYALSDSTGRFEMPQVPAGNYQLVCWRPNWRIDRQERDPETLLRVRLAFQSALETNQPVVVKAGQTTEAMFQVSAE